MRQTIKRVEYPAADKRHERSRFRRSSFSGLIAASILTPEEEQPS